MTVTVTEDERATGPATLPRPVEVAIVGAGLSGLGMARALRELGIDDFVVLERAGELGGTWRDNTYPGCACDIPSFLYSYSDELHPGWTRAFAGQAEIWDYMRAVAVRHDVVERMRFGHEVTEAAWDADTARWQIRTTGGDYTAEVLVAATGMLADPAIPRLPGMERFGGAIWHSARWDHDYPLDGRRVAVIGTGASAIQFVPEIQPRVARLHVFQRTPPWVLPRGNPAIPPGWRRRLARSPRLLELARRVVFSAQESAHVGFRHPAVMKLVEGRVRAQIAAQVPDPQLRAKLIPDYRLGCKRILGSTTWYPALCRDNVALVTEGIAEVTPSGITDRAGVHHEVDAIIFATGFQATDPPISHRLRGQGGTLLADRWQGSPRAHLGMTISRFPNLFFLLGPNTGLGHNSVLLMIEAQIDYLKQALRYRSRHGVAALEPTPAAEAAWVAEVDRGTAGSVWTAGGCLSWYVDRTGRNSTLWPGSVRQYQRRLARLDIGDYAVQLPRTAPAAEPTLA